MELKWWPTEVMVSPFNYLFFKILLVYYYMIVNIKDEIVNNFTSDMIIDLYEITLSTNS